MPDTPQIIAWESLPQEDGYPRRYEFRPDVSHDEDGEINEVHQDGELVVSNGVPIVDSDALAWEQFKRVAFCHLDDADRIIGEDCPDMQFARVTE